MIEVGEYYLRKQYTLFRWYDLVWVVVILAASVLPALAIWLVEVDSVPARVITILASGALGAIAGGFLTKRVLDRQEFRSSSVLIIPSTSFLKDGSVVAFMDGLTGSSHKLSVPWELRTSLRRAPEVVFRAIQAESSRRVDEDLYAPYVFVIFKPVGEVSRARNGNPLKRERLMGRQYGHWIEVEYTDDDLDRVIALVHHELAHLILEEVYPHWSEAEHHDFMKGLHYG